MPRDKRIFAPFPIEMDEHPKIIGLTDRAFRALIESTFYCRRRMTDGFVDERIVRAKWGVKAAAELERNDPERPSWVRVDGGWQIHDFLEYHPSKAEIEAKQGTVSTARSEAGKRGAEARWKQPDGKPMANGSNPIATDGAETETETETEENTSSEAAVAAHRPEIIHLLDVLDDEIIRNGGKPPRRNKTNADAMRLLLDRDGRTPEQVEKAIRWAQSNGFWRAHILSAVKLREKYDTLRLRAVEEAQKGQSSRPSNAAQAAQYALELEARERTQVLEQIDA